MIEVAFFDDRPPVTIPAKLEVQIIDDRAPVIPQPQIEVRFFDDRPSVVTYSKVAIPLPPAEFDHPAPNMVVEYLSADKIAEQCGNQGKAAACVLMKPNFVGDKCFVLLPAVGPGGVSQRTQDLLRRHENGHCNGWEHLP
jgi:hypothetical protein